MPEVRGGPGRGRRFRSGRTIPLVAAVLLGAGPLQAAPSIEFFFGNATTDGGRRSVAFEKWDDALGRPVREITFDEMTITGPQVPLSTFAADDQGLIDTSLGEYFGFKTGGDAGLFPLFRDPDNRVIRQEGTRLLGLSDVSDLLAPNRNLLGPGPNRFIDINFGEGLDLDDREISNFGVTEAVGAFVSTLNPVTLSIFDSQGLPIFEFTQTPTSFRPFFMGIALPDEPIIATARFTFGLGGENAIDGLVFTSVSNGLPPPAPPIPAPGTTVVLALAGFAAMGRRRRA